MARAPAYGDHINSGKVCHISEISDSGDSGSGRVDFVLILATVVHGLFFVVIVVRKGNISYSKLENNLRSARQRNLLLFLSRNPVYFGYKIKTNFYLVDLVFSMI